jgi:hypothetical protein
MWVVLKMGEAGVDRWAPATVLGSTVSKRFKLFPNLNGSRTFKIFQILTNPKGTFTIFKKLEKYGFEDIKKMNNFLHRNFFRFRRDFE